MTAAAASPISARRRIPTDSELFDAEREYRTLCDVTIPGFYSGRSGRYHATDTAKKNMLHSSVLRGLRFGRLPSDEDRRALFMDHWSKLSKADRKWMTAWRKKICPESRSAIDTQTQQVILDYAVASGAIDHAMYMFDIFALPRV